MAAAPRPSACGPECLVNDRRRALCGTCAAAFEGAVAIANTWCTRIVLGVVTADRRKHNSSPTKFKRFAVAGGGQTIAASSAPEHFLNDTTRGRSGARRWCLTSDASQVIAAMERAREALSQLCIAAEGAPGVYLVHKDVAPGLVEALLDSLCSPPAPAPAPYDPCFSGAEASDLLSWIETLMDDSEPSCDSEHATFTSMLMDSPRGGCPSPPRPEERVASTSLLLESSPLRLGGADRRPGRLSWPRDADTEEGLVFFEELLDVFRQRDDRLTEMVAEQQRRSEAQAAEIADLEARLEAGRPAEDVAALVDDGIANALRFRDVDTSGTCSDLEREFCAAMGLMDCIRGLGFPLEGCRDAQLRAMLPAARNAVQMEIAVELRVRVALLTAEHWESVFRFCGSPTGMAPA